MVILTIAWSLILKLTSLCGTFIYSYAVGLVHHWMELQKSVIKCIVSGRNTVHGLYTNSLVYTNSITSMWTRKIIVHTNVIELLIK